jgi:hypothetical protein
MASKVTFVTAKGQCSYPYLNKADFQYDADGIFKTKLRMSEEDAAPLIADIKSVIEDEFGSKAKTARVPYVKDPETGVIEFTTKSKYKPPVVDSNGTPIQPDAVPIIRGGSTIKLAGTISPYNAGGNIGVSLHIGGVQIIQLSEGASALPFSKEEGGFVVAANDNEPTEEAHNF